MHGRRPQKPGVDGLNGLLIFPAAEIGAEGSSPYANGRHPGGSNFLFCDGAVRYIKETIQGSVYAKLITPAGESLPQALRQHSLSHAEFQD